MADQAQKLIHAHVFDPTRPGLFVKPKKSDAAEYHTVTCSASDRCELFARKQCAARQFMGWGCMYGNAQREHGPTQRAKTFYTWLSERRKQAEPIGYLDAPPVRLARVGDHVWLPYSHMDIILERERKSKSPFVPLAEFTPALVVVLANARPEGWFGGEIRSYQQESVPLFVAHLSESFPDLLREATPLSPRIQAVLATLTKVGRKAKLRTLRPSVGTFEGWTWDGTCMTSADPRTFPPFTKFGALEMRITPAADAVVTITDNAQVTAETVFVD